MNSLVKYDTNNVIRIEYYVKNIIFTIVCLVSITYILIKIRRLFSETVQHLTKMIYDLDCKLTSKIQELDQMKQSEENTSTQLKTYIHKTQQLDGIIVLLESRVERHTTEFVYFKQNYKKILDEMGLYYERQCEFKIEISREITDLKCCNEEKMRLIKAYNKDAFDVLNNKLTSLNANYDDTFKDMVHNMDSLYDNQISLKTEFEERNKYVAVGFVCSMSGSLLLYKNADDVTSLRELLEVDNIQFDISCLKYFPKLKTIDLFQVYRQYASPIYVSNMSNILDKRDNVRTYTEPYGNNYCVKTHLLFKEEGTRKVIEYIRSIRPDIELIWYDTPI